MGFKRRKARIEPIDLDTLDAQAVEAKVIAGVRKYATHEENWSQADRNTPFLGRIIGMGIESSNLADITLSIERQFLTRRTKRVEAADGTVTFEDGEVGSLRIPTGQDATAATPGLVVKMLMELGHMKREPDYLAGVVSFGHVVTVGDGYRLNDGLQKEAAKAKSGAADGANLKELVDRAQGFVALLSDPKALAASRQAEYEAELSFVDELKTSLARVEKELAEAGEADAARLRSEQAELSTRVRMATQKLRVAEETAAGLSERSPVDSEKIEALASLLAESLKEAEA